MQFKYKNDKSNFINIKRSIIYIEDISYILDREDYMQIGLKNGRQIDLVFESETEARKYWEKLVSQLC